MDQCSYVASCVAMHGVLLYKTQIKNILISRHLLQLHHDDGGEQRGVDGGGAQLPPQDRGDPRDAHVGPQCLSPVAPMDSSDGPTGKINIPIK